MGRTRDTNPSEYRRMNASGKHRRTSSWSVHPDTCRCRPCAMKRIDGAAILDAVAGKVPPS